VEKAESGNGGENFRHVPLRNIGLAISSAVKIPGSTTMDNADSTDTDLIRFSWLFARKPPTRRGLRMTNRVLANPKKCKVIVNPSHCEIVARIDINAEASKSEFTIGEFTFCLVYMWRSKVVTVLMKNITK